VPSSDFTYAHWSTLQSCHFILITVNTSDTVLCCKKLADLLTNNKNITVFSVQRGVKNSSTVKDELAGQPGLTVVEGVVGFAVLFNQRFNTYVPTIPTTAVLFERLSADAARVANGPLNLLESTNLTVYYRKIITRTHFLGAF